MNVEATIKYSPVILSPDLVLPVVLLRVSEDPVAEPADVSEGSMPLVPKLLQPQHRAIATVCEWGLQQLEDLLPERKSKNCHCLAFHG